MMNELSPMQSEHNSILSHARSNRSFIPYLIERDSCGKLIKENN